MHLQTRAVVGGEQRWGPMGGSWGIGSGRRTGPGLPESARFCLCAAMTLAKASAPFARTGPSSAVKRGLWQSKDPSENDMRGQKGGGSAMKAHTHTRLDTKNTKQQKIHTHTCRHSHERTYPSSSTALSIGTSPASTPVVQEDCGRVSERSE